MPTEVNVVLQQIGTVLGLYRELRQQSQYDDCSDLKGREQGRGLVNSPDCEGRVLSSLTCNLALYAGAEARGLDY